MLRKRANRRASSNTTNNKLKEKKDDDNEKNIHTITEDFKCFSYLTVFGDCFRFVIGMKRRMPFLGKLLVPEVNSITE